MRVALCLSGLPRVEEGCVQHQLSQFKDFSHIDVFGHFWEGYPSGNIEYTEYLWRTIGPNGSIIRSEYSPQYEPNLSVGFRYYPENAWAHLNRSPLNTLVMYNGIMRADRLRQEYENEKKFSYDVVIRSRVDITIDQPINLLKIVPALKSFIITPRNGHYRDGYCDQFAIGSSQTMAVYSSLFNSIEDYLSEGLYLHSETLLRKHLESADIPILLGVFKSIIFRNGVAYDGTEPLSKRR